MSIISAPSRITKESQRLFISDQEIPGVQNVRGDYTLSAPTLKYIGLRNAEFSLDGPQVGNFGVSTLLISQDFFLKYTGQSGFNGYVLKSKPTLHMIGENNVDNFSFNSGYLTSYSSRCSVGEIPQIDVNFNVLGNIGRLSSMESNDINNDLNNISQKNSNIPLKIISPGSITLSLDEINTNRILNYDLSININRNSIYSLGDKKPIKVEINYPIEVNLNFQMEIDRYNVRNLHDFPFNREPKIISININDFNTDENILNYSFNNMLLISEVYNSNVNNNVIVNLSYKGYLNR
jgi:hypothetical protein